MKKIEVIKLLRDAKKFHITWLWHARFIVSGAIVDKDAVPVLKTDCNFGQWYYGKGQALSVFPEFASIGDLHARLHATYLKIIKQLFPETKHSFLSELFGKSRKHLNGNELTEAKQQLEVLENASKMMLSKLQALENRIISLKDDEISSRTLRHN